MDRRTFIAGLVGAGLMASWPAAAGPASEAMRQGYAIWEEGDSNRFPQVMDLFRKALAYDPQNPDYHTALGRIYLDMGRFDEARAELTWSLAFRPRSARTRALAYLALGQALEVKPDFVRARKMYRLGAAVRKAPADITRQLKGRSDLMVWTVQQRPLVAIRYNSKQVPSDLPQSVSDACQSVLERASATLGVKLTHRSLLYLVPDQGVADRMGLPFEDINLGRAQAFMPQTMDLDYMRRVMAQMVAHRIDDQHTTDRLIQEGCWTWLSTVDVAALLERVKVQPGRPALPALQSLSKWDPSARDVAASFVEFLVRSHGVENFRKLWSVPGLGRFDAVYARPLDVLEQEWQKTL